MKKIEHIKSLLREKATIPKERHKAFYKTGVGDYAEHDQFIGVLVPILRQIAKDFHGLNLEEIEILIASSINEERLLALLILIHQYQKAESETKTKLYEFYLNNLKQVNNWNLVDASAHLIIGAHIFLGPKDILLNLAHSHVMWERRVAIVSTWYFIRQNDLEWTFKIAQVLLNDSHDLIHKAVGWMLREAGKREQNQLITFLDRYANQMPRTMLRYAIEKFQEPDRRTYLGRCK